MADFERLNELYGQSEDPWHTRSGWRAQRQRDLILASLPDHHYASVLEPGCSHGELTVELARRADSVLAVDSYRDAVAHARERAAHLSNVTVQHLMRLPEYWPRGITFDLVVLNELGSMSTTAQWQATAEAVRGCLGSQATVLACHWRHYFAGRTANADALQESLASVLALPIETRVIDADFVISVWTTHSRQGGS